jgi:hypothetical protein
VSTIDSIDSAGTASLAFLEELFERYQRSERALVATLAEMYVQGVSTRKVKAITEELCGHAFSASSISAINTRLDESLKALSQIVMELYPADQQATIIAGLRSTNLREVVGAIGRMQSTIRQQDALPGNIETLANTVDLFNRQYAWNGKYDPNTDEIVMLNQIRWLTKQALKVEREE